MLGAEGGVFSADGRDRLWTSLGMSERVEDRAGAGRTVTRFSVAHLGADRLVRDSLAVGFMLQADRADETPAEGGRLRGSGWLAGPYLSAEIAPGLYLGLRGAIGASDNTAQLAPAGDGRVFTARFTARRSLWRASLRGETRIGAMTLTPALDLAAMREAIPDHVAGDEWHSVAIGGSTLLTRRVAVSATAAFSLGPGPEAPTLSLRPEWSASLVPEAGGSRRTQGWALEVGLRSGPSAAWLYELKLRNDALRGGAAAATVGLTLSRAF